MESAALVHCVGILRCPITGQVLSILSPAEIAECNRRQASDALVYRNGTPAPIAVTFALGTPGRDQIYRVEDSIAWLLPDLALIDTAAVGTASFTAERKVVQSFYDEYGWVKSDDGLFISRDTPNVPRHAVSGTFLHDKGGSGHDDSGAPWGA
jgi:uncharacterized protein YbaR (Trm112 family)